MTTLDLRHTPTVVALPTTSRPRSLPARAAVRDGALLSPSAHLLELEQRCTQMWAVEPTCSVDVRTPALETLLSVERRLSGLAVREAVTGRTLDRRFSGELEECQLELDLISDLWHLDADVA